MSELQSARERRGLSLDDVSQQARIPRHYLVALERNDTDVLPEGRFRDAYERQYRSFLGLPRVLESTRLPRPAEPTAPPLETTGTTGTMLHLETAPTRRLLGVGFIFTLVVALSVRLGASVLQRPPADIPTPPPLPTTEPIRTPPAPTAPEVAATAHRVSLRAIENVRVKVETTEGTVRKGVLPGGKSVEVDSDGPITVEVSDLTRVVVHYNGDRIEPLHNLSQGRRLVFVPEGTP